MSTVPSAVIASAPREEYLVPDQIPGPRAAVRTALSRAARNGTVIRVRRGLYFKPIDTRYGPVKPKSSDVVRAVIGEGVGFGPTGYLAARVFGLTTQVPAREEFVSLRPAPSGLPRDVRVARRNNFRRAALNFTEVALLELLRDWESTVDGGWPALEAAVREEITDGSIHADRVLDAAAEEPSPRVRSAALRLLSPA